MENHWHMWKIRTPTRYIYYDECTPQDTLPSSSCLFGYAFNNSHPLASNWQQEPFGDSGAILCQNPNPPAVWRDCSWIRKIWRKTKKSLILEVKMNIVRLHARRPSPHLGRWYSYNQWPACHADVGLNPPHDELTDNQLSDVPENFEDSDDKCLRDSVTPTPNPPKSTGATSPLSTAVQKPPSQTILNASMRLSSASSSSSLSVNNPLSTTSSGPVCS